MMSCLSFWPSVSTCATTPWAPPPPTPVVDIAVPEPSMLTLRVILDIGEHRIARLAAAAIVGYLSAAPVTAARLLDAGCGAALAAAAADADADAELAGAACHALRRVAGIDPAAVPGVVSTAVGACFRALAMARTTEAPANTQGRAVQVDNIKTRVETVYSVSA